MWKKLSGFGGKTCCVVRKYCREFVREKTKIMKNMSTCYSRNLKNSRPVRMQAWNVERTNSLSHLKQNGL